MSKATTGLSWGERFGLIDAATTAGRAISEEQICTAFGVTGDELETAREIRSEGNFQVPSDFDAESFGDVFGDAPAEGAVSVTRPDRVPAETATVATPAPKKRGRKGTKINEAFSAIDTTPVPAEDFATERGVSLNVLRQAKRFDRTGGARVRVKKIDGTLMVYRDAE